MTEPRQIRTLATLDLNEPATVARMKLPEAEVSRLSDLGMRIGSTVRVLQASEGEPLLVAVGDAASASISPLRKKSMSTKRLLKCF